jgi:hypothetical protein
MTMPRSAAKIDPRDDSAGPAPNAEGSLSRRAAHFPEARALADPPNRGALILNPYPLTGAVGLGLALMPWLISGATLLQHQPFDHDGFRRQLLEAGATMTALPPSLLAALAREGVWRDPACKVRRLGCVWPMAQPVATLPELDGIAPPLFDLYPICDLVSLVRMRVPGTDSTRLPLGPIATRGEDGDSAVFRRLR